MKKENRRLHDSVVGGESFVLIGVGRSQHRSTEPLELKEKILLLLTENDGEMEQKKLCTLLGITAYEIPWGYNIGYAQCLQASGEYHLILSGQNKENTNSII